MTVQLVLLPGLDGTGELFAPLVELLPRDIVPWVVSYPSDGDQSYAALLPLVQAALPSEGPVIVLGWSFSGPLALMLAAEAPDNLRGVILCSSFVSNPQPIFGWLAPLVVPPLLRLFPAFSQAKALLGGYSSRKLRRQLVSANSQAGAAALAQRVRQVLRLKNSNLATRCQVPLLYVAGARDWVVPSRNVAAIRRQAPSIEVVEVAGPHLVLLTNPQEAAPAIIDFCRRVDDG